jgi:transmembrane sensor
MNKEIIDKYFRNQAAPEEVQKVLEWFETPEGQKVLQERMNVDFGLMERDELKPLVPELDSDQLYKTIHKRIHSKRKPFAGKRKSDWLSPVLKAAAMIAVILTTSVLYFTQTVEVADEITKSVPVVFQTDDVQQSIITLRDGSVVRLNHDSELIVAKNFLDGTREVTLTGEAYFEIEHDADQPFIIHANQSSVEVLGTAFNVRSITNTNNVQVAVVDGRVSFANKIHNEKELSVVLSKGQYGYLDIEEQTIAVDEVAIENYMSWKSGRLVFEELTLGQVCTQLHRLYQIECRYENEEIKDLQLTANFSNDSMEKTLSVIALTLKIDYNIENEQVYWIQKAESEV